MIAYAMRTCAIQLIQRFMAVNRQNIALQIIYSLLCWSSEWFKILSKRSMAANTQASLIWAAVFTYQLKLWRVFRQTSNYAHLFFFLGFSTLMAEYLPYIKWIIILEYMAKGWKQIK